MKKTQYAVFLLIVLLLLPANLFLLYRRIFPAPASEKFNACEKINLENSFWGEIITTEPQVQIDSTGKNDFYYRVPQGSLYHSSGGRVIFSFGCNLESTRFDWIDRDSGYIIMYGNVIAIDYNKDLLFDCFRSGAETNIAVNGKYTPVLQTGFSQTEARTPDNRVFEWVGDSWQEKLPGDK